MSLSETYNRIAADWHAEHAADTWSVEAVDVLCKHLHPGDAVLDVGCAGGLKSRHFADLGFNVVGIDISEHFIEIAKREVPSAEFHILDMRNIKELGRTFNAVFAQASLLHIPKSDVPRVLEDMYQVLEPGGYLYLAVKERREGQEEEAVIVEDDYGYTYERFFSFFTFDEIRSYFRELGIVMIWENVSMTGKTGRIQVIGKK